MILGFSSSILGYILALLTIHVNLLQSTLDRDKFLLLNKKTAYSIFFWQIVYQIAHILDLKSNCKSSIKNLL